MVATASATVSPAGVAGSTVVLSVEAAGADETGVDEAARAAAREALVCLAAGADWLSLSVLAVAWT